MADVSVEQLLEEYNSGLTLEQVAKLHGMTRQAVWGRFQRAGVEKNTENRPPPQKPKPYKRRQPSTTRKHIDMSVLKEKYRNGMSVARLANYFEVSSKTILNRMKEAGIVPRGGVRRARKPPS